ncbi:MAG: prolyl oligopeptidase family serine peptidase [Verrucomicrobiae bacterium]
MQLHGTADTTVDPKQSERLAAALKAAGVADDLVILPGAPHTFDLQSTKTDLRLVVLDFLDKHLKSNKTTSLDGR